MLVESMPEDRQIDIAPLARRDLVDIWRYHAETASADVADKLLRDIDGTIVRLNNLRIPGRPRDELLTGLRSITARRYIIFFRIGENRVEIVRILHERRDLPPLFGAPNA